MKKILVIDESPLFRNYLIKKLTSYGFEVRQGANGLDGWVKMRNELPDLIIMDYYLSRKSSGELLEDKARNRNCAPIPVIMVASQIDKRKVIELASFKVNKIISKPLRMEQLLDSISSLLGVELKTDDTPCIIEAHFNENILFIEISQGLNNEKIEQLQYKINELLELYQVRSPKVLIMMSSLDFPLEHYSKLDTLLKVIKRYAQPNGSRIKILTGNEYVKNAVEQTEEYQDILVYSSLDKAMDSLLGLKADNIAHDEVVREKLLTTTAPKKEQYETIQLRFDEKSAAAGRGEAASTGEVGKESALFNREVEVAVVDDDIVIQELLKTVFSDTKWKLQIYQNGREFITDKQNHEFSLTFLDLMMPEMNGFEVLEYLKKENDNMPVIVFSALSRQETVVKAVSYGIKSYLTKPLKPEQLLQKAEEVLSLSF
ncbi:MAG: response regulator [Spirochaetota bacterium]|nr:response regulator [Spirochaetota bacterium]